MGGSSGSDSDGRVGSKGVDGCVCDVTFPRASCVEIATAMLVGEGSSEHVSDASGGVITGLRTRGLRSRRNDSHTLLASTSLISPAVINHSRWSLSWFVMV